MLKLVDLHIQRGGHCLLGPINLSVPPGTLVRIHGHNGSGKSSMLRTLAGLTPTEQGHIHWHDASNQKTTLSEQTDRPLKAAQCCYIGHANALKESLSPLENLKFLTAMAQPDRTTATLSQAFTSAGLAAILHTPLRFLSQGQKRRTALVRLSQATEQVLWLLDEPFVALDNNAVSWLSLQIGQHVNAGGIVLFTSHQTVDIATINDPMTLDLNTHVYQPQDGS